MLERLVVGYGTARGSADALALAHMLASVSGGEVIVASHADPAGVGEPVTLPPPERYARMREPRFVSGASRVAALCAHARAEEADTIVLGTRAGGERAGPGTARRVLEEGDCTVAIAPEGFADEAIRWPSRVGVLIADGDGALVAAADVVRRAADDLVLLGDDPLALADAGARIDELGLAHVWVSEHALRDRDVSAIIAGAEGLDLLVVARLPVEDEEADRLLARCPCPLLIPACAVAEGEDEDEDADRLLAR